MENKTSSKIVATIIEDNSLEVANHTELEQNDKTTVSWNYKTPSFEFLVDEVNNFQDCSIRICQNWLKAHESEYLCSKDIQRYATTIILLQNVVELVERIKIKIQCAQLQKLEISQTVGAIVSNCLDIESEQVTPTANLANDLGIDSLSWQELLITLDETFTIRISDEIAGTLVTVQQLIDCVILIVQKENRLSPQLQF